MVNMNAVDDKKSCNTPNQINRTNVSGSNESVACDSKVYNNSDILAQKLNGTSQPSSNCSKPPITNGAYSKINSFPCSVTSCSVVAGPSCTTQAGNGNTDNGQTESSFKDNKLLLGNNRHTDSLSDASNVQRPSMSNNRATFHYDGYSSSEDEECCIYTYKGDSNQLADLPSSFFRLDLMSSKPDGNSRNSSPDMDYLEMDFDPGPSNDRFSSSGSECNDVREGEQLDVEALMLDMAVEQVPTPEPDVNPSTPLSPLSTPSPVLEVRPQSSQDQPCPPGPVYSPPLSPIRQMPDQAVQPLELATPSPYCYCIGNKLISVCIDENFNEGDGGIMVWKEQEAREKHVTQIAVSACGATAVINTLLALNVPYTISSVKLHVDTRLRAESAPLTDYLMSRCNAGATHVDMIRGLQGASQDMVYARFFHMYPQRNISLVSWLSHWIRKGAVPILTLNIQRGVRLGEPVPDSWHHQMVYGVSARGIHLTNPLEVQPEARLWAQLASPSEMLIRREDVMSRWTPDTPLCPLIHPSLPLWRRLNVLGQVVNMVRESQGGKRSQFTQYITIPASYSSGVTIALLRSNPAYDELRLAPELPFDPFASTFR